MKQLAAVDSESCSVMPVVEPVIMIKDADESLYSRDPSLLLRSEDINNLTSSRNSNILTMKLESI